MTGDAAVGVDQNLPAGQSAVAGGTTGDEPPAGVHQDLGVRVKQVSGDDLFDNVLGDVLLDLLVGGFRVVLGADDHGVDPGGDSMMVLNGHLRLAIWPEVGNDPLFPDQGQLFDQAMGKADGKGHQLGGLVAGEPHHHSLVAGAGLEHGFFSRPSTLLQGGGDAFADISRLLLDGDDHSATLGVDAIVGFRIAGPG